MVIHGCCQLTFLLPALAVLLFFSGLAALVYQVVWLRLLSLTFGVTVHAATTVLASFMAGLAIGSAVAGRLADRSRQPLRLFGVVEILIGLSALCTPAALEAVHRLYGVVASSLSDASPVATALRFVLAFAVLIVPTALMGATMPLVVKSSLSRIGGLGGRIGLLYAANTTGAIVGALVAGFHLLPNQGLGRSFLFAAVINVSVGLIALAYSWLIARSAPRQEEATVRSDAPAVTVDLSSRVRRLVLFVFVLSGFASLALEVIWFRALVIFLGPSTFAFTVMLAVVLAGIALGSYVVTPLMRLRVDWLQVLAVLQFGVAVAAVHSFSYLGRTPRLPRWLEGFLDGWGFSHLTESVSASIWAILPTALFLGLAFPVGLRLWAGTGDERSAAKRVGLFLSMNVCGGILGSVVAGFVLIPMLTLRGSLIVVSTMFLASAVALQAVLARRNPIVTVVLVLAVVGFVDGAWNVPNVTSFVRFHHGRPILMHEEGAQTTVTVFDEPGGSRALYLDGRHQSSDAGSMVFIHRRIGLLPAVLHGNPKRALVVGLGGGATAGALSQVPGLEVDVVELSDGVVHAADFFTHVNFDLLRKPNVHLRVDDGRNYLLRTRTRYDVITADAIIPTHAGATNLYSVEYFELVRNALASGGLALHWNGGGTNAELGLILRAFVKAFPYTTLWGDGRLMVGSLQPITVSRSRIEQMLGDPAWRHVLQLMNVERFDHLARTFRADSPQVRAVAGDGPYLSDDRPMIEYFAPIPSAAAVDVASLGADINAILRP